MKMLIADDHPMVRDALARTARSIRPDAEIVEAKDHAELVGCLTKHVPELALVDLNMPGMSGILGVRHLRESYPALRLVIVSGESDPVVIRALLNTGIVGFVPKSESPPALIGALQLIFAGGVYLPSQALSDFRDGLPPPQADAGMLTVRQRDVLRLLMQGESNKSIARTLGLVDGTVKIHISAILRILQARNRTEAVVLARKLGLVE